MSVPLPLLVKTTVCACLTWIVLALPCPAWGQEQEDAVPVAEDEAPAVAEEPTEAAEDEAPAVLEETTEAAAPAAPSVEPAETPQPPTAVEESTETTESPAPSVEPAEASQPPATVAPTVSTHEQLWADFNHYVRIARPDMALGAATKLLAEVDDERLLTIVEGSEYTDFEQTLKRAEGNETLRDIARQIGLRIQAAKIARSRDRVRILADIEKLSGTERERRNVIERLRAAGPFAAPHLLATLLDGGKANLHPFVETAMVAIGRPMVYPLSEALAALEPTPMSRVARILAEIGYPRALPYLKEIIENPKTDPYARSIVETAYKHLSQPLTLPANIQAAELFLTLGQNYYESGTSGQVLEGLDSATNQGVIWSYDQRTGLIPIPVPGEIFPDVLAMRAARRALRLNPEMGPALSLWLMGNLRRENRLPEGAVDRSYPTEQLLSPQFYLEMAGPLRQHDVLERALDDNDPELALDAIQALGETAGTDRQGNMQPLLRALNYPDRRVRFGAARALAEARPQEPFLGSHRVVPVLAEAGRQTEHRQTLVLAADQESLNKLQATLKDLDYSVIGGLSLEDVVDEVNAGPGVDVILTNQSPERVEGLHRQTAMNYKLAAAPILAMGSAGDVNDLNSRFADKSRVHAMLATFESEQMKSAVEQAIGSMAGKPIAAEEAAAYASHALVLLHEIGVSRGGVYEVVDALPALLEALGDTRENIVQQSGRVLALIPRPEAQQAIAEGALDEAGSYEVRVSLLNSLAESARRHGNMASNLQIEKLLELVKTSRGDLAIAAARAHGALTLPTSHVVELIIK